MQEWESCFQQYESKMLELYPQIGDSVYAIYGKQLFQKVHERFKELGLQARPRLPCSLMNSREWGESESDRERWMWSKISRSDGTASGTIVIIVFHDHLQVRIPRAFRVIALEASSPAAVVRNHHQRWWLKGEPLKAVRIERLVAY